MRLWSVHPRYLDRQGLTACWREALLAQKVLTGVTRGYRHHPQLERFRAPGDPGAGCVVGPGVRLPEGADDGTWPGDRVVAYLHAVADEAAARGYGYDRARIAERPGRVVAPEPVPVTDGQLDYEWTFLRRKLAARSPDVLARWTAVVMPDPHPCFVVVPGPVASWEVLPPA